MSSVIIHLFCMKAFPNCIFVWSFHICSRKFVWSLDPLSATVAPIVVLTLVLTVPVGQAAVHYSIHPLELIFVLGKTERMDLLVVLVRLDPFPDDLKMGKQNKC